MFDTVILLTGPTERTALPAALLGHNPHLTVIPVEHPAELLVLHEELLRRARLIAFVTPVIVPKQVLEQIGYGAFNFHPGPPDYPGWAPAHFALYDHAREFGATVHVMTERVDDGPIIEVASFAIPPHISVLGLEGLAYSYLAFLFWRSAKWLASDPSMPPGLPIRWGTRKHSRRSYRAMCDIPPDISQCELERRIKVFGGNHFDMMPTINLHGVEFRLVPSQVMDTEAQLAAMTGTAINQ